jgi:transcriptional regulator with XRE-family HTH domain
MEALESFAQRVQRIRVVRGISERELAERVGMTVHQYEAATSGGMNLTCSLLVDLADALDVSITELTERTMERAPSADQLRAFCEALRVHRAAMTDETPQRSSVDRRLARLDEALEKGGERGADALDASVALMRAIERNDPVRVVASRYARLVLHRCGGKKGAAGRVLGIQHQTLGKYLRYAIDDHDAATPTTDETISKPRISHPLEDDVEATAVAS